ncbi:MAG: winged helix-turn-helix transcriptional regulator [Flavobacteriaceae bacterium]|nr:winged helix-turn-helix transcriptional regulator [Flavobacteriaceae bacterium]
MKLKKPPLKVEYSLTEFGKTLIPLLKYIANWGAMLLLNFRNNIFRN